MNSTLCHSMHCHKSLNITGFYWHVVTIWLGVFILQAEHCPTAMKFDHTQWSATPLVRWCSSECCISYIQMPGRLLLPFTGRAGRQGWKRAVNIGPLVCQELNASLVLIFLSLWLHAYWINQLLLHRENITNYFAEHSNWQGRLKCFCFAYSTY